MSQAFKPNDDYLIITYQELEMAWRMLASPEKLDQITDTLDSVRQLNRSYGPEKAIFTMVSATAWLTQDEPA
ncbi:hypothetical protein ABI_14130 [Asticcacaulis biprosthecium C19]|uniref:Uncharacterized protein n=1 Tax=Asticcacaulis biprosthecium C19 TaxID=715226 RepID=F4QII5_9CAUL|nr:hypothetical protein [Asticcacaulis biprosthecium]EGF92974.1 hypothetical protein ABI_14130 [Asticcacaulis biprosthecium C19]